MLRYDDTEMVKYVILALFMHRISNISIFNMTVTQMIDVERTNSRRTCIDHEQVQSADFETCTLNGILRVWGRHVRNDAAAIHVNFATSVRMMQLQTISTIISTYCNYKLIVFMLACDTYINIKYYHAVKHHITLSFGKTPMDHQGAKIFGVHFYLEPLVLDHLKKAVSCILLF